MRPDFPGLCARFPDEKANGVGRLPFRRAVARRSEPYCDQAKRWPIGREHTFAQVRQNAAMQLSGRTACR